MIVLGRYPKGRPKPQGIAPLRLSIEGPFRFVMLMQCGWLCLGNDLICCAGAMTPGFCSHGAILCVCQGKGDNSLLICKYFE